MEMVSIVNGLEDKYGDNIAFHYLNARDGSVGEESYRNYNLRGHPVTLIVDSTGSVLWERSGIIPSSELEQRIIEITSP